MTSDSFHENGQKNGNDRSRSGVSPDSGRDAYGNPIRNFALTPDEDGDKSLPADNALDNTPPERTAAAQADVEDVQAAADSADRMRMDDEGGTETSEDTMDDDAVDDDDDNDNDMIMMDTTGAKLDEIQDMVKALQREFQNKIKYDAHKNKIIDDLHQELLSYKNNIITSQMQSFVMDIIQFVDNMRKLGRHYREMDESELDAKKLFDIVDGLPMDVEDLIGRQGVFSFNSEAETFDATRQRVLKRIETGDKSRDKIIAERIHPGYEWDERVIRPEIVSVYVYKSADENSGTGEGDE